MDFRCKSCIAFAEPKAEAKFVKFTSFLDPAMAPGQTMHHYPWPYTEGLTIAEANNELALLATGIYGKPLPNQNGAPIRLVGPWKYGFKGAKSIVRDRFRHRSAEDLVESLAPDEYGFYANVNPDVDHPRWSQKRANHRRRLVNRQAADANVQRLRKAGRLLFTRGSTCARISTQSPPADELLARVVADKFSRSPSSSASDCGSS